MIDNNKYYYSKHMKRTVLQLTSIFILTLATNYTFAQTPTQTSTETQTTKKVVTPTKTVTKTDTKKVTKPATGTDKKVATKTVATKKTATATKTVITTKTVAPVEKKPSAEDIAAGKELVTKSDCLACHKLDIKLVGPAYLDVAKKYPASEANYDLLSKKVIAGGSGNWGTIAMAPHATIPPADVKKMVEYILSLK